MPTLLEIGDERAVHMAALEDLLFDVGGVLTDEAAEAAIDAWLKEADAPLKRKLDAYGAIIRERELLGGARKQEAARLTALATTDANLVKRLKERLKLFFEAEGIDKIECTRFKYTLAGNGGLAPLIVREQDPEKLPRWAQRITITADNEAIRGELDAGKVLDFAELAPRGKHILIK